SRFTELEPREWDRTGEGLLNHQHVLPLIASIHWSRTPLPMAMLSHYIREGNIMRRSLYGSLLTLGALTALLPAAPRSASGQATTVYSAAFEAPAFAPGPLDGQQGFFTYLGRNATLPQISAAFPSSGAQSVRLDTSQASLYGDTTHYGAFYYPALNYDPVAE